MGPCISCVHFSLLCKQSIFTENPVVMEKRTTHKILQEIWLVQPLLLCEIAMEIAPWQVGFPRKKLNFRPGIAPHVGSHVLHLNLSNTSTHRRSHQWINDATAVRHDLHTVEPTDVDDTAALSRPSARNTCACASATSESQSIKSIAIHMYTEHISWTLFPSSAIWFIRRPQKHRPAPVCPDWTKSSGAAPWLRGSRRRYAQ